MAAGLRKAKGRSQRKEISRVLEMGRERRRENGEGFGLRAIAGGGASARFETDRGDQILTIVKAARPAVAPYQLELWR